MDKNEQARLIKVARKYYDEDCMQGEIAKELNISRPQVSRILKKAKDLGIVKITIVDPWKSLYDMEQRICKYFNLKEVRIVEAEKGTSLIQSLAYSAAEFLSEIIHDGDTIGVAWGTTLYQMVQQLEGNNNYNDIKVVQIKGGVTHCDSDINPYEVPKMLAKKLNAELCYLPMPVLVESEETRKVLCKDKSIKEALNWADKASVVLYSIGYPSKKSIIARSGYMTAEELESMREEGAVGDICSRFFDINGNIFDKDLDSRITSIQLEELKKKKYSVGIAGGKNKFYAVLGALRGGFLNTLIIDKDTAKWLINIIDENLTEEDECDE